MTAASGPRPQMPTLQLRDTLERNVDLAVLNLGDTCRKLCTMDIGMPCSDSRLAKRRSRSDVICSSEDILFSIKRPRPRIFRRSFILAKKQSTPASRCYCMPAARAVPVTINRFKLLILPPGTVRDWT